MGRMLYETASAGLTCLACHGDNTQAGAFLSVDPAKTVFTHDSMQGATFDLVTYLELFMPKGAPADCDAQCSADIAAYIATWTAAPTGGGTAVASGKQLFELQCDGCHPRGPQGWDPNRRYQFRGTNYSNLKDYIEGTMPVQRPSECDAKCSSDIVEYVRDLRK